MLMIIVAIGWFVFAYRDWKSDETTSLVLLEFTWFKITKSKNPRLFKVCVAVEVGLGLVALYFGLSSS